MAKQVMKTDEGMPSYLKKYEGTVATQDNFGKEDMTLPRIKLLQGTSNEIGTFNDAKPGIFWHSGFDVPLGESFDFIICSRNKKYLLVAPLHDGQGILARSDDAKTWDRMGKWEVSLDSKRPKVLTTWEIGDLDLIKSGVADWGSQDPSNEDSPPAATLFYDYLVLLPDHPELGPSILSLARSQIKKAKKGVNDKVELHTSAGRPMQSIRFRAGVVSEESAAGPFFNYQFIQNGFADEKIFEQAMSMADVMRSFRVADEVGAAAEGDAPKAESDAF